MLRQCSLSHELEKEVNKEILGRKKGDVLKKLNTIPDPNRLLGSEQL